MERSLNWRNEFEAGCPGMTLWRRKEKQSREWGHSPFRNQVEETMNSKETEENIREGGIINGVKHGWHAKIRTQPHQWNSYWQLFTTQMGAIIWDREKTPAGIKRECVQYTGAGLQNTRSSPMLRGETGTI